LTEESSEAYRQPAAMAMPRDQQVSRTWDSYPKEYSNVQNHSRAFLLGVLSFVSFGYPGSAGS
jgi:hypothetical protein